MIEWFEELYPVGQAALAGTFTWAITLLGASLVFFTQTVNRKWLDAMLGFAAGVMIAASFWSLLAPAIAIGEHQPGPAWLPALLGFLLGAAATVYAVPILTYALAFAAGAMNLRRR